MVADNDVASDHTLLTKGHTNTSVLIILERIAMDDDVSPTININAMMLSSVGTNVTIASMSKEMPPERLSLQILFTIEQK